MAEAPEQIYAEPGMPGYVCEKCDLYTVQYIRADIVADMVEAGHLTYAHHVETVEHTKEQSE